MHSKVPEGCGSDVLDAPRLRQRRSTQRAQRSSSATCPSPPAPRWRPRACPACPGLRQLPAACGSPRFKTSKVPGTLAQFEICAVHNDPLHQEMHLQNGAATQISRERCREVSAHRCHCALHERCSATGVSPAGGPGTRARRAATAGVASPLLTATCPVRGAFNGQSFFHEFQQKRSQRQEPHLQEPLVLGRGEQRQQARFFRIRQPLARPQCRHQRRLHRCPPCIPHKPLRGAENDPGMIQKWFRALGCKSVRHQHRVLADQLPATSISVRTQQPSSCRMVQQSEWHLRLQRPVDCQTL